MLELTTLNPEIMPDDERLLESRYWEIVFSGLLAHIHDLRQAENTSQSVLRRQSDAVQKQLRIGWPDDRHLNILLPDDAVVFDHDYRVIREGAGAFTADIFTRIDHIGAVFLNRDEGEWARFSDAASARFEFFERSKQGLPNYE